MLKSASSPTAMLDQLTPFCPGSFWIAIAVEVVRSRGEKRGDRKWRRWGKEQERQGETLGQRPAKYWGSTNAPSILGNSQFNSSDTFSRSSFVLLAVVRLLVVGIPLAPRWHTRCCRRRQADERTDTQKACAFRILRRLLNITILYPLTRRFSKHTWKIYLRNNPVAI